MAETQYLGLVAILFAIFIVGMILGTAPMKLIIILAIGALVFLTISMKDNMAVMGFTVLIFALLLYLIYPSMPMASFSFSAPEEYFSTLLLVVIVLVGLIMAYKATQ
ncbi:MAG: hypothetical protein ACP5E4_00470 [Candidatus Aenigmatarchaeota archaeon]